MIGPMTSRKVGRTQARNMEEWIKREFPAFCKSMKKKKTVTSGVSISEEEFNKRFINAIINIKTKMDMDRKIYGDSYILFTDRSIEVIAPDKVVLKMEMKK